LKIVDFLFRRECVLWGHIRLAVALLPMLIAACAAPVTSPPVTSPPGTSPSPATKSTPSTVPNTPIAPLAKVTGTLTARAPLALTADAVVTVQLIDVSRQDVAAVVLAEQIITRPGQAPIPFELEYDPDSIKLAHRYAVQARIEEGGKLRYRNDTVHFVLTHGNPNTVDLAIVPPR
jgi:putative lipoprotein